MNHIAESPKLHVWIKTHGQYDNESDRKKLQIYTTYIHWTQYLTAISLTNT